MRNVFDQYEQAENKLTHALVSALHNDRRLLRPFVRWLGVKCIPPTPNLYVDEQIIPGRPLSRDGDEGKGLPDACIYDSEGWAVLLESKVQAGVSAPQLQRHVRTCERHGYKNPRVFLIAVDKPKGRLQPRMLYMPWKEVYAWFAKRVSRSEWARRFVEYIEVFESKMIADEYDIRGTLTMFKGFHFDDEHPYTYHEGKRLLKLIREELLKHKQLIRTLRLDSKAAGRPAITRGEHDSVWDFIPLKAACGSLSFTRYPHVTIALLPYALQVLLIAPHGMKNAKSKLKKLGFDEFCKLIGNLEKRLRPIMQRVPGAQPMLRALQRHYKSRRSVPVQDGELRFDLRVLKKSRRTDVKYQPTWVELIYNLMTQKRTNIQLAVDVHLPYSAKIMQGPESLDLIAETWIAMKQFLDVFTAR